VKGVELVTRQEGTAEKASLREKNTKYKDHDKITTSKYLLIIHI